MKHLESSMENAKCHIIRLETELGITRPRIPQDVDEASPPIDPPPGIIGPKIEESDEARINRMVRNALQMMQQIGRAHV